MTIKEQILKTLQYYKDGEYDTATFCNILGSLYYFEPSGYRYFSNNERKYLDELVAITERFSPYKQDEKSHIYFTEKQVKDKFNEVIKKFNM